MELRLSTLGHFILRVDDRAAPLPPTQKARCLLVFLALSRNKEHSRERLIEVFWPDFEPERAREGLRSALSAIRKSLRAVDADPSRILKTDRSIVQWCYPVTIDIEEIERLSKSDRHGDWRAGAGLYAGDFLEGNYEEWAVSRREQYSETYEALLAKLDRECADVSAARLLLARNPYDEHAYATVLEHERSTGRLAAACELFRRYRATMLEAGIDPSAKILERFSDLDDPQSIAIISVPFVARTQELEILDRGLRKCTEGGSYGIVVSGEAGIGKTSLLARASALAAQRGCTPLQIEVVDDEGASAVWGALYARTTGAKIGTIAATATDVPGSIASAIAAALPRASVLFVDDAHTLRGEALATLVELARVAAFSGFGLVIAMRPEGLKGPGARLDTYVDDRIVLGPLVRNDVGIAVSLALGTENPELDDLLFARSEGHPLFLVALLESLVRNKTLDRERGRWRIARMPDALLELPRDLRTSIEMRLRSAGDDAAVVASALALEPSATAAELASALDYDEKRVFDALDQLISFALLGSVLGEIRFHFLHDLVREVAAGMLNAGRRVALHREFARLFEKDCTPENRAKLARHLREAGLMSQAARAYLDAVSEALIAYAFYDGLEWCADGLKALERAQSTAAMESLRLQFYKLRTESAIHAGGFTVAAGAASETVRLARALQDAKAIAAALILRSALQGVLGESTQRLADALEALHLATDSTDIALIAGANVQASSSARAAGMSEDAKCFAIAGRNAARQSRDRLAEYAAYEELLRSHISWWRFGEAAQVLESAGPVAEAAGICAQARLQCVRASLCCSTDRFDEARVALERSGEMLAYLSMHRDTAPPDPATPLLTVRFGREFLKGIVATAEEDWREVIRAIERCRGIALLAELAPYRDAVAMLEIGVQLCTNEIGRNVAAPQAQLPGSLLYTSDCPSLFEALLAARYRNTGCRTVLRSALDALEENANAIPLDCDRAFAKLAAAANECGENAIAARAAARSEDYYALRMAAAAHRSAKPRISSGSMSRPSA